MNEFLPRFVKSPYKTDDNLKKALKQGGKLIALNIKSEMNLNFVAEIVKKRIHQKSGVVVYVCLNDKMYKFQ